MADVPQESDTAADIEIGVRVDDERLPVLFGPAYPQVVRFAELLTGEGVKRGLIGPREIARLWERHLINSAAVAQFLPPTGTVVDVGSGAGLPGIVLAAMRPDLHVVLLEPMERRTIWLQEVVTDLGLTSTEVLRGRAEEQHGRLLADVVTARAVAPMDRLVEWTLPLLGAQGVLLAMKGSRAADEVAAAASLIRSLGGAPAEVLDAPTGPGFAGTSIVRVVRERVVPISPAGAARRKPASDTKKKRRAHDAAPTRGPGPSGSAKRPSPRG